MGQILGLGITHYPGLAFKGDLARRINQLRADPALPDHLRSPEGWPEGMRAQWGEDEGRAHVAEHRQAMIDEFRRARETLDEFNPDFVVLWGDDQYENFHEDAVPAFAVLAYDGVDVRPWAPDHVRGPNAWDEPEDKVFPIKGDRRYGKFVATALLSQGFDVAYSYKPLHGSGLGHAVVNSVLYMDWDRRGFDYPVVPITVNSYGRDLVRAHGRPQTPSEALAVEDEPDPHGPQPWRCFQLGGAVARAAAESPWRVALIASSSWSHSFLVPKHALMYPDVESDRRYYAALVDGDWEVWRSTTIEEAEDRGHQELLNWFCLAGAMAELDRKPDYAVLQESWITNSDKVFASFKP
jgi:hypothetical protein